MGLTDQPFSPYPGWALATDLDGTLIPLPGRARHRWALARLAFLLSRDHVPFLFATGRHFASAHRAIGEFGLPVPRWIVCNVGTDIFESDGRGGYRRLEAFQEHLHQFTAGGTTREVREALGAIPGLILQEEEALGPFKLSFYAEVERLEAQRAEVAGRLRALGLRYDAIASIDPGHGIALLDLLPEGVHKAHAVCWLADHAGYRPDHVIYAGDSGNDFAALVQGFRGILVGNASPGLAERVREHLARSAAAEGAGKPPEGGFCGAVYEATEGATAGVLEGCLHYGLFAGEAETLSWLQRLDPPPTGATEGRSKEPAASADGRWPVGDFSVWAPRHETLALEWDALSHGAPVGGRVEPAGEESVLNDVMLLPHHGYVTLRRAPGGYFRWSGEVPPGAKYRWVDAGGRRWPDPQSRFQPEGVHGPSQWVPTRCLGATFCQGQPVYRLEELVIYEVHVGTFTPEGTFRAIIPRLAALRDLGITVLELMPLAQPAGTRNWGYDGVALFAPQAAYGSLEDLLALLAAAQAEGLLVVLDVVYNHLGPEGNYLEVMGPYHRTDQATPWGGALDFANPAVRDLFLGNALYWLGEVGFDGLRLDAIATYFDQTQPSFLAELREAVDALGEAQGRKLWLFGESNLYDPLHLQARPVGHGLDAIWCDDHGHALLARLTGQNHHGGRRYDPLGDLPAVLRAGARFGRDPAGHPVRLSASPQSREPHGADRVSGTGLGVTATENACDSQEATRTTTSVVAVPPSGDSLPERRRFVIGLQNHDWVGNQPGGQRLHQWAGVPAQQVAAALTFLSPGIPLLFMGEEYAESAPFLFFTDFSDENLRRAVDEGRAREHAHLDWSSGLKASDVAAFHASKLRDFERGHGLSDGDDGAASLDQGAASLGDGTAMARQRGMRAWYRAVLQLRREGLAEGWLRPENLSVTESPALGTLTLVYSDEPAEIVIEARLPGAEPASPPLPSVNVVAAQHVCLLDSRDRAFSTEPDAKRAPSVRIFRSLPRRSGQPVGLDQSNFVG